MNTSLQTKTVSVIIPTCNYARYLSEALDGVLNQTYKDFEIIVVDDGSVDHTREVVEKYQKEFPGLIRYFHQENQGSSTARNTGIKNSHGKYIAFLDADDVWLPTKLKIQITEFENDPQVDLLFTNAFLVNSNGSDSKKKYVRKYEFSFKPDEMFEQLLLRNFVPLSSVIVKRYIIDKIGMFDTAQIYSEDFEWLLRVTRDHRADFINECLVKYRVHPQNKSHRADTRHRNPIEIRKKIMALHPMVSEKLRRKFNGRLAQWCFYSGYALFEKNYFTEAREEFFTSATHNPFIAMQKYIYLVLSFLPVRHVEKIRRVKRNIVGILKKGDDKCLT